MASGVAVAIVGVTGAVGQTTLRILEERKFPVKALRAFASERSVGKTVTFKGETIRVEKVGPEAFKGVEATVEPALASGSLDGIVAALGAHPAAKTVAIVGHEPTLGALLARMLGAAHGERLAFKKGGAALVDLPDGPSGAGVLLWFLKPKVLRALAGG